jgi:proton-coupled amino acid transporter
MNLACCFGICSAYLVFVASTLATVFPAAGGQNALVWAITPAMVLLAWMRSMAGVSIMALVGNVSVAAGMAFTGWFSLQQPSQLAALPLAAPAGFGSYFGSVAFLFFIHFTLPAIQAAMAAPARFMPAVWKGFGLCAAVGASFGALCAASFGPSVSSVVITHLGATPLSTAVKLLLCVNLLFTFPIVCRSAFLVVETLLQRARGGAPLGGLSQKALRTSFVLLASLVATSVPSFGQLLSLVGGISLSLISLVFPPLILLLATDPAGGALLKRGAAERAGAALVAAGGLAVVVYTFVSA